MSTTTSTPPMPAARGKEMACMGEDELSQTGPPMRDFSADGHGSFTCNDCGWTQESEAGGASELCHSATWRSRSAYQQMAQIARAGGFEVPDTPPIFEP